MDSSVPVWMVLFARPGKPLDEYDAIVCFYKTSDLAVHMCTTSDGTELSFGQTIEANLGSHLDYLDYQIPTSALLTMRLSVERVVYCK